MNTISSDQEKYSFLNMCNLCRYVWFSQAQSHLYFNETLLSGESYELIQAKVFDMRWSSIVKGQNETLVCALATSGDALLSNHHRFSVTNI